MNSSKDRHTPPLFRQWKSWYLLVLGFLLFQMVVYYLITQYFQ